MKQIRRQDARTWTKQMSRCRKLSWTRRRRSLFDSGTKVAMVGSIHGADEGTGVVHGRSEDQLSTRISRLIVSRLQHRITPRRRRLGMLVSRDSGKHGFVVRFWI